MDMDDLEARELMPDELALLMLLLSADFEGSQSLLTQAQTLKAKSTGDPDNYESIYLLPSKATREAQVQQRVPVEAEAVDKDKIPINVLLHIVDGYLHELEIYKVNGTPVIRRPEVNKFNVIVRHC